MTVSECLTALDRLPAVIAELREIRDANRRLCKRKYAGSNALAFELGNALEALDSYNGACQLLAGIQYAKGDEAVYGRWDAALAARMNLGER